jgi:hypothetical protein
MRTIKLFFLLALAFFACADLRAQVTIGSLEEPKAGVLLDLNSSTGLKGGLLLSNVAIIDLDLIPAGNNIFPGVTQPDSLDTNWGLQGAIVYNTNPAIGTGVYVWTGRYWMPVTETEPVEQILFTVEITKEEGDTYYIPLSGHVGNVYHSYNWDVSIDGVFDNNYSGTGSEYSAGIALPLSKGRHQIKITPNGHSEPGWGNAFGYSFTGSGALTVANKEKLISIDAPITTLAFAPKIDGTEDATNASYMFAHMFLDCYNLTTAVVIKDSYKLPKTVTDLSSFLRSIHYYEVTFATLATPIDLTPLSNWIKDNNSITNLSDFLRGVHRNNSALASPIDLTPLSHWFKDNSSIKNLSYFFRAAYFGNVSFAAPIDLTPLSGWFSDNNSINNLQYFFSETHYNNTSLATPIDLTPLSGWFSTNTPINNLSYFLDNTHYNNTNLKLNSQVIFPDWIKTMTQVSTDIWNVANTFYRTFYLISAQNDDIAEPKFQGGESLSGLGRPNSNKTTYTGRNKINPVNDNWK